MDDKIKPIPEENHPPDECKQIISLKEHNIKSGKDTYMFCLQLSKTTCSQLDWDFDKIKKIIYDAAIPMMKKKVIVDKFNVIFSPWVTLVK